MRLPVLVTAVMAAAALAGCGGGEPTEPSLAPALAERLAAASEAVASRVAAGDGCGARERLTRLDRLARAAIAAERVPVALRGELRDAIAALDALIVCDPPAPPPPPPPTATTDEDDDEDGDRGNGKEDKEKDNGKGRDEGDDG